MLLHTFYDDGWRMHWWVKKGKWNVWVVSNSSQNQRLLIDPARGDGIDGLDFEQTRHEEFSGAIPHDIYQCGSAIFLDAKFGPWPGLAWYVNTSN